VSVIAVCKLNICTIAFAMATLVNDDKECGLEKLGTNKMIFFYYLAYSFIENVVVINVLKCNKPLWKRSVFHCIGCALVYFKD